MKKYLLVSILVLITFMSSSCSNETNTTYSNSSPNINYSDEETSETIVESVVDDVYSSVVSINTYLDGTLYGSGSGVFFANDDTLKLSYILTCYHVIADGNSFEITLSNGDTYSSQLVGGDVGKDIAVLSVQGLNFNCATLPSSDTLRLGSMVVVVGNPLGTLPGSISVGYVSYIGREVYSSDYRKMKLIQTDTAINSGNSGGGMFDTKGRLVGIVNAKYADEGIEGLGFAIAISDAMDVANSVLATATYNSENNSWKKGYYNGSWELGFTISNISIFPSISYVGVSKVSTNSNTCGYDSMQIGDRILSATAYIDNEGTSIPVNSSDEFYYSIYQLNLKIGDKIIFSVSRGGQQLEIEVPLIQFIPE